MSPEVYLINLGLALILFFLLRWHLRKITSMQKRTIVSLIGGIVLAPVVYVTVIAIIVLGFSNSSSNIDTIGEQDSVSTALPEQIAAHFDTFAVERKIAGLVEKALRQTQWPHKLTIAHTGFEDAYTQDWFFDDNFELQRINYDGGGESFSGNGCYWFQNSRLTLAIDTSRDEGYREVYSCYVDQPDIAGGIRYDNLIQVSSDGVVTIKGTKKEIVSRQEFDRQEKRILADMANHLAVLVKLKPEARFIDNTIELTKRDSITHTTYTYEDVTKYSLDTVLFRMLSKQHE